jgi:hypothetical protein
MADKLSLDSSESKIATVLTDPQMEWMQSLMDPNNHEQSDTYSLIDQEEDIEDTSLPAPENLHIEATNLEEERMFKNAKMFVDRGNGCFTTK